MNSCNIIIRFSHQRKKGKTKSNWIPFFLINDFSIFVMQNDFFISEGQSFSFNGQWGYNLNAET